MENENPEKSPQQHETSFIPVTGERESLLAKLDMMEQELEKMRNEQPSYTSPPSPDKLDTYEETLKNIAFKLDTLLADLLEAEVREYTYPEFLTPDETTPPWNRSEGREKQRRSVQEILVIAILITAVFLVGMTFGLWGSFFFGL